MASLDEPAPERIRILRLIGRLNRGGPTRQALALCRGMSQEKFPTTLAFGQAADGEEEDLAGFFESKIFLERISSLRRGLNPFRDLAAWRRIRKLLRREKPQILHTHLAKAGALGRLAARRGVLCVHTFHGTNFQGHLSPFAARLSARLERRLARKSAALVAVSEAVRADLLARRIAPAEKIVVIPPGLDLDPFLAISGQSGALRKAMKMTSEQPLIVFSGRLVPVKNPLEFVEAAAAVSIANPRARFAVLGDGHLRGEMLRQIEALDLRERFFFAGWRSDVAECLADADIVVSTSRSEGMPVSLIEAMAAGRFVIANPVGGVEELLGRGRFGALVMPTGESLEETILRWLGDAPGRGAIAAAAREEARQRYSGARLAQDMVKLYKFLLSGQSLAQFRSAACR